MSRRKRGGEDSNSVVSGDAKDVLHAFYANNSRSLSENAVCLKDNQASPTQSFGVPCSQNIIESIVLDRGHCCPEVCPPNVGTISAGSTDGTLGEIVFSNSNGVSFGMSGQTVTASVASQAPGGVDVSISGNTSGTLGLISSGTAILAGGNNITLSQDGQSITISGPNTSSFSQSVQTQNLVDLSLSGNTSGVLALISSGTAILAGGNNITLSQNGQSITISGPNTSSFSQSVQTQNLIDLSLSGNTSGVLALISSGTAILAGGNNITLSQNGQSITISGPNTSSFSQSVQTQNLFDLTLAGNTSGTLALVSSGTLTLAGGNSITLSQVGNAITISGASTSQSVQTQNLVDVTVGGNTSGTLALISSGTLTLAGGNSITLSQVGNAITISGASTSQSVQTQNNVDLSFSGNTSGTMALISSGTAIIAGGNNITISQDNQSVTISGPNMLSVGMSTAGNTDGVTALVSNRMVFVGGNSITLSQTTGAGGATISIIGPVQAVPACVRSVGMSTMGNTSGNTGYAVSRFNLVGGNNITLSGSTTGVGASMSITVSGPNMMSAGMADSGNTFGTTGFASQQLLIVASGGASVSQSLNGGSATLTISGITQSVQTQNNVDLSLSGNTSGTLTLISSGTAILAGGNNITLSQNGQSVTISAPNMFSAGVSTGGATSGSTGTVSNQVIFVGSNGITLRESSNAGSATISIIAPTIPTVLNSFVAMGISDSGNTAGTTGLASYQMVLVGSNNITLSQSLDFGQQSGTISIYAPSQSVQTQNNVDLSLAGNTSGTLTLISSGTAILAGGNNVTLSQNGQSVTVKGVSFVNSNDHTFGLNAGNLTISYGSAISMWPAYPISTVFSNTLYSGSIGAAGATSNTTISMWHMPMALPAPLDYNEIRVPVAISATTSVTSQNWSFSNGVTLGLYSLNVSTLSLIESWSNKINLSVLSNAVSGSGSATFAMSWGGSDTNATSQLAISNTSNTAASFWTLISGSKMIPLRTGSSSRIPAGQYYLVLANTYLTSGSALAAAVSVGQQSAINLTHLQDIGLSTASTTNLYPLLGLGSTRMQTDTVWPLTIHSTNITSVSNNASFVNRSLYVQFIRRS